MAQTAQQGLQKIIENIDGEEFKGLFRLMGVEVDFSRNSIASLEESINTYFRGSTNADHSLILIGTYLGETIIRNTPGAQWDFADTDDIFSIGIKVSLENGEHAQVLPLVRVSKFHEDPSDGLLVFYDMIQAVATQSINIESIADREWVETPFGRIRKSEYGSDMPPEHNN